MEVSTVSPLPASPTEGDDLCEMDVTNVALHSVALLICLCGLVGNGAVVCLLTLKIGNGLIFDLAVIDFLFLLFALPSALLFLLEDVSCSPIMSPVYVSFLFHLSVLAFYWGLYRLSRISPVTNMKKLCKLCWCHPPWRLLWVVDTVQYWAFFAVLTIISTVTFLCPSEEQQHCRVAVASMFNITLLLLAAPMVITRTIDFIKAKCDSQQQQPERRDVVIFLVVLFTLLLSLWNSLQQFSYISVPSEVVFLLACITSSIKPFIYFLAGRCWSPCSVGSLRVSLQRVFEEQKDKTAHSKVTTGDTGV